MPDSPNSTVYFYEHDAGSPFQSVEGGLPFSLSKGDSLRLHTTEPSQPAIIDRVHHEISIKDDSSLFHHEIRVYLRSE